MFPVHRREPWHELHHQWSPLCLRHDRVYTENNNIWKQKSVSINSCWWLMNKPSKWLVPRGILLAKNVSCDEVKGNIEIWRKKIHCSPSDLLYSKTKQNKGKFWKMHWDFSDIRLPSTAHSDYSSQCFLGNSELVPNF